MLPIMIFLLIQKIWTFRNYRYIISYYLTTLLEHVRLNCKSIAGCKQLFFSNLAGIATSSFAIDLQTLLQGSGVEPNFQGMGVNHIKISYCEWGLIP